MSAPIEPLDAIPLEYSSLIEAPPLSISIRVLLVAAWLCVAISPVLIAAISTEWIIGTGGVDAVIAITLTVSGFARKAWWLLGVAVAHAALVATVFSLINIRDWSPREAHAPVMVIASVAAVALAWPTWRVVAARRR